MTRSPLISVSVSAAAAAVLMALAMPASAVDSEIYGAPGLVPHPVKDYLPITVNKNMCVMCHKEQKGDVRVKGEIPKTMRSGESFSAKSRASSRVPASPTTRIVGSSEKSSQTPRRKSG